MLRFKQYLLEAKKSAGIQHLEHPADLSFGTRIKVTGQKDIVVRGKEGTSRALKIIQDVAHGQLPITRKIDDRMSFHAIRHPDGKVGVKYKGPGTEYSYSENDINRQHPDKEHVTGKLKSLLKHLGKVLPTTAGEYQGGYMSVPGERHEHEDYIGHKPNTVTYRAPKTSPEGKKLAKSKLSVTVHTTLHGPEGEARPITDMSGFGDHPDVHIKPHVLDYSERHPETESKAIALDHISKAAALANGHDDKHLLGHETYLRTYYNSTIRNGTEASVDGYRKWTYDRTSKEIDKVSSPAAKERKTAEREATLKHIDKNKKAFATSLKIHGHLQAATNHLADGLDKSAANSPWKASIDDKPSGGEGYVAGGVKIVNRKEFSAANFANAEKFKKKT